MSEDTHGRLIARGERHLVDEVTLRRLFPYSLLSVVPASSFSLPPSSIKICVRLSSVDFTPPIDAPTAWYDKSLIWFVLLLRFVCEIARGLASVLPARKWLTHWSECSPLSAARTILPRSEGERSGLTATCWRSRLLKPLIYGAVASSERRGRAEQK